MFGLGLASFSNMQDSNGILFFDGKETNIQSELKNPSSLLSRVTTKWNESIAPNALALKRNEKSWEGVIALFDGMNVTEFLEVHGWTKELIDGFAKVGVGLGSYGAIMHLSALEVLRLFVGNNDGYDHKNLQLKGGMETLPRRLLNDDKVTLHPLVEYGCEVISIMKQPDERYIVTGKKKDEQIARYSCDFVVVTVPLPAMRNIHFSPPLNRDLQEAINKVHYVKAIKVFLQTKSPFWLRRGVDGKKFCFYMPCSPRYHVN